jgi:hypothetical protein
MSARYLLGFASVCLASTLALGCASGAPDEAEVGQSGADLTSSQCAQPTIESAPHTDSSGRPIDGTAHTTVTGCILASSGETGAALLGRATALLTDTNSFASVTDPQGQAVFSSFRPQAPTGSLTSPGGLVQDVDVALNMQFNPSTRLRVTRKQAADGSFDVTLTNITALKATIAIFPVTAVNPGDLSVSVKLGGESNGITVSGAGDVTLQVQKDQANQTGQIVSDLFDWLKTKLAQ